MNKQRLFEQIAEHFATLEENNGGTTKASQEINHKYVC